MRHSYVTTRRLAELARTLSERERQILATMACVRLATSRQLERLHFTDVTPRQARQVLASLADRQLLLRLPRVIGGVRAGSAGYLYTLGRAGARLVPTAGPRPRWSVGIAFIAHTLAITELYVRLVEAGRAGQLQLLNFTTEPACWRTFSGPAGGRLLLKPDADVRLRLDSYEDHWLIEVDRATESGPTLARKAGRYVQYWRTGQEQAATGVFPRVLWLVPDTRRYDGLVDVLGRQPAEAWTLFAVALYEEAIVRFRQGAGA